MQLTDIPVFVAAQNLIAQNQHFWLCTILNTYGSAPRPIGSVFITDGEHRYGSISGGCLEDAFVEMLNQNKFEKHNQLFTYGDHASEQGVVRELPCGGTIELLIEYIEVNRSNSEHFLKCANHAIERLPFKRQVTLQSNIRNCAELNDFSVKQVEKSTNNVKLNYSKVFTLLLIGIGQVTEEIARLGLQAGFEVKVCDMRKQLASSWVFDKENGGVDITWMSPDIFVEQYADEQSAVLALAHDPSIDDVALMSVFDTKAFYIGAMGSHRTTEKRIERLKRICEIKQQQLSRLHAPIGLNIGSKTPFEIAISTLADIIRVKNHVSKEQL